MSRWTVPIRGGEAPASLVGGKGAALCRLAAAGFPVPDGFCITTEAYARTLSLQVVGTAPSGEQARWLRRSIRDAELPEQLQAELAGAYQALCDRGAVRVAVRSSSTNEDGANGSFAGQAESYLDVAGLDSLIVHVKRCWASLFRKESLLYSLRADGLELPPRMAVVVQECVAADAAGVLFTANPLSGDRGEVLISSAFGLGEGVVGGRAADTYYADKKTGQVRRRHVDEKTEMLQAGDDEGLERCDVPSDLVHADSLSHEQVRELVDLGRRIEALFGVPMDVEWAYSGGTLHVLQARPITAGRGLGNGNNGRGARNGNGGAVWSNINVGEALPGVGTPMTWSILRAFSRRGFEQAFRALGLTIPEDYTFVGGFHGRIYLNLTEFMSVASQIPFFPPERLLALGGGGGLEQLRGTYEERSPLAFMLKLPLTLPRMAVAQGALPFVGKLWRRLFADHMAWFDGLELRAHSRSELLTVLDRMTRVFNRNGTLMLACASNALSSYIAVLALLRRWVGEDAVELQERLFVGLSAVRSAAPGLALLRIARRIREHPELIEVFENTPADAVLGALARHGAGRVVRRELEAFLQEFGNRAPREAELSTPRWREDPSFIVQVLRAHLNADEIPDPDEILDAQAKLRQQATRDVAGRMPAPQRPIFRTVLRRAQNAARLREALRDHVVDTLTIYRRFLLEVGVRLVEAEVAGEPDDVFFLTLDEVREALRDGPSPALGLRIAARRAEYEAYCEAPDPPDTFRLSAGEMVPDQAAAGQLDGPTLKGLGGSPGLVTGTARVILTPQDGDRLSHGDILVAPYTDVGWTPLFLLAAGVVMDMGGPLSHSCVVAREYGIPAVVNVKQGTRRIRDGQRIIVDGDRGVVYLIDTEDGDADGA